MSHEHDRRPDVGRSPLSEPTDAVHQRSPGKRTLTEALPFVQAAPSQAVIRAGADLAGGSTAAHGADPAATAATAAAGVAGASSRLPHHQQIQSLFGPHDLSGVSVASDSAAAAASNQLGARAYAYGNRIALPQADLHTEAHEAAHVIQQRSGRVAAHGTPGDAHERHADAVADRVVAGRPASDLLDEMAGPGGNADLAGEHVQLFTTQYNNIVNNWGYVAISPALALTAQKIVADERFRLLRVALQTYEAGATVRTAEAVLEAATAFADSYERVPNGPEKGNTVRITNQVKQLIDQAHTDLHTRMKTVATTAVDGRSKDQLVDDSVGQLATASPERRMILRHEQKLGMAATLMGNVTDADGPAIIQSWRARGDMYHVGAVLNLFPQLKVILYDLPAPGGVTSKAQFDREKDYAERWDQAGKIADYYGQPNRVFYTRSDGVSGKGSKGDAYTFQNKAASGVPAGEMSGLFIDVGGCTTILGLDLAAARKTGAEAYTTRKQQLAKAVAPDPQDGDGRATSDEIMHYLAANGWRDDKKYVILNFRDSGHMHVQKQIAKATSAEQRTKAKRDYDPVRDQIGGNHPDLDTGTVGIKQLAKLVTDRGFTPVFMGEEPADAARPHLIKYWESKHQYGMPAAEKKLCRGGRAAEAFFIRTIADHYDVRLLAMRSGVTDQLAFLGIPTISIDIDNFHQAPVPELSDTPGYQMGNDETAHSWARGTKLEAGLERDYGRAFIDQSRPLGNRDAEGNYQNGVDNFDDKGKWKGAFAQQDLTTIDSAIGFYFGTNDQAAPQSSGVRHKSHPFHPDKMQHTDQNGDSDALHQAAGGKIETGLNPDTVLAHMRSVLAAQPPKTVEAVRFADSQLAFMEDGKTRANPQDLGHRTAKLDQRRDFLRSVIALLQPRGAHAKYQAELDALTNLATVARRVRMEQAVSKLRDAIRFPGISRNDGKVVAYLSRIDAVDLKPIETRVAEAKAVCSVEHPTIQAARADEIVNPVTTAHTTFTSAVADGLEANKDRPYYKRAFTEARDKLAAIAW